MSVTDTTKEPIGGMEYRRWLVEREAYQGKPAKLRDKPSAPAPLQAADSDDVSKYRRACSRPRELQAEAAYQRLMRVCIDEPLLAAGIWMCCPEEPGETWRDREPDVHPSPLCLPDETIGARQFAAEWALLWGEVAAWASLQVEPRRNVEIDADDLEFVKQLTGNLPSMIVSKWCNDILAGKGKRRERSQREHDGGGGWDNAVRIVEDANHA